MQSNLQCIVVMVDIHIEMLMTVVAPKKPLTSIYMLMGLADINQCLFTC